MDHYRLTAVRCLPWLVRPRTLSGGPLMKSITNAYTKRGVNPNCHSAKIYLEKSRPRQLARFFAFLASSMGIPRRASGADGRLSSTYPVTQSRILLIIKLEGQAARSDAVVTRFIEFVRIATKSASQIAGLRHYR